MNVVWSINFLCISPVSNEKRKISRHKFITRLGRSPQCEQQLSQQSTGAQIRWSFGSCRITASFFFTMTPERWDMLMYLGQRLQIWRSRDWGINIYAYINKMVAKFRRPRLKKLMNKMTKIHESPHCILGLNRQNTWMQNLVIMISAPFIHLPNNPFLSQFLWDYLGMGYSRR